jgi:transcriptional regulator with XRE-family HTH domain
MESDRLLGRNGAIWLGYCRGKTQEALAQEHGITQGRVSQIIKEVRDTIPELDRAEMVQKSLDLLERLQAGALEIWDMAPAPVTVGQYGEILRDPDSDEVIRDHAGRLRALETAVKVGKEIRQLVGLDAAQKLDLNVSAQEEQAAERLAAEAARRLNGDIEEESTDGP